MMSFSIFHIVFFSMLLVFLLGATLSVWYFFRPVGKREANWLFSFFLGCLSLSLLQNLLVNIGLFNNNPRWYFIPIQYTLALGPLLFFFVKSRLFPFFHLQRKDFKHFILPTLQAVSYLSVGFKDAAYKESVWLQQYIPYGKPLEGALFVIGFSFYLYFSYRFIRYKLALLTKRNGHQWEIDKVMRLKRLVKGILLLFIICAGYIVGDFLVYQFLGLNLYDIRGYTYIGDLSFTAIVLWVTYYAFRNAFFPSRHRLAPSADVGNQIQRLFQEEEIYLDDELDARKLSYYLKIKKQALVGILNKPLTTILREYRISAAEAKMKSSKYRNYSEESIGLAVGFPYRGAFLKARKKVEINLNRKDF